MSLDELYQDLILDHYRSPRHKGLLANPSNSFKLFNPLCGDEVEIFLQLDSSQNISDIKFTGKGCALSQASASMMCDNFKGLSLDQARARAQSFFEMISDKRSENELPELGDALSLSGVKKFAARTRCVLLAWEAFEQALRKGQANVPT